MGAWRAGAWGLLAGAVYLCSAAPAQADGVGWLTLKCTPDADVKIDGTDVGMTPLTHYQLSAAHHKLELTAPGKHPRRMGVSVVENEETSLSINL